MTSSLASQSLFARSSAACFTCARSPLRAFVFADSFFKAPERFIGVLRSKAPKVSTRSR
ncbi:hypothetical protein UFOVP1305_16 [uncultured Caudovirales phage]|uniref:Uncharacterized protein n=1 Tax=uncultured Caudovirales phage TaxID=2100421 RepID=A0A6J5RT58_9CAUD|nr:hypothetical protein UFOVP896_54 [uncultured Caudovirales phage]CAB4197477.1 hypothetical protein UFOVP1305_16 [uncultured Caudovirales phage]